MVVFHTQANDSRIRLAVSKHRDPYPGLVTVGLEPAAFALKESRFVVIQQCRVENSYAIRLGPDTTVALIDHQQVLKTATGTIDYTVPLALLLSYGAEITKANVDDYLDALLAYILEGKRENGQRQES